MATATPVDLDPTPEPWTTTGAASVASPAVRYLVAALSLGAGAIHFAMVPSHAGESLAEGLGFAAAGWLQLIFAGAILAKPGKVWLKIGVAANLAFIAVWTLSRTRGLPFGAHAGLTEAATAIDMLCIGLEAGIVLFALMALVHPEFLADLPRQALAVGAVVPVAALIAATAAIASPSASNHSASGHDHGNEVATGAATTGHPHANGADDHGAMDHSQTGPMDHGHDASHGNTASNIKAEDRCDWKFNTQTYWAKNPPTKEDPSHLGSHAEHSAGNGEGNEHGAQAWSPITDKKTCDELQAQIDKMQAVAKKYPTAQDAMNAGCIRVTIFVEGIAAHYACFGNGWDAKAEIDKPEMILYGGSQPWAPVVGLSYMVYTSENPSLDPNQQLWVRYMPFHYHSGLCVKGALVIGGDNSDPAKCAAQGGRVMGKTGFMGHYWMPECNSPDGVFSAANPRLDIGVANVNDDPTNDPKAGGDPTKLVADPCKGSTMGNGKDDKFEAPSGATNAAAGSQTQAAAGKPN